MEKYSQRHKNKPEKEELKLLMKRKNNIPRELVSTKAFSSEFIHTRMWASNPKKRSRATW